jgi:type IV pilus assembly protein PilE
MRKRSSSGFTLIELIFVVLVLGILTAIAYPNYTDYVTRARRSDATTNLSRIAALEEKFFSVCGSYTNQFNGLISDPNPALRCTGLGIGPTAGSYTTLDGHYTLTFAAFGAGGVSYTLSASPTAGTAQFTRDNARCTTITIDNAGVINATGTEGGANGGRCWRR